MKVRWSAFGFDIVAAAAGTHSMSTARLSVFPSILIPWRGPMCMAECGPPPSDRDCASNRCRRSGRALVSGRCRGKESCRLAMTLGNVVEAPTKLSMCERERNTQKARWNDCVWRVRCEVEMREERSRGDRERRWKNSWFRSSWTRYRRARPSRLVCARQVVSRANRFKISAVRLPVQLQ